MAATFMEEQNNYQQEIKATHLEALSHWLVQGELLEPYQHFIPLQCD